MSTPTNKSEQSAHQLINQTSGETEWYTPQPIIEAARATMGGIDLDPASSRTANKRVRAKSHIDEFRDGLTFNWYGKVWLNHPFGRIANSLWIVKLEFEFTQKKTTQACCITYACTSEKWFQPLLKRPQCFLFPRTNYILPDGSVKHGVTKGSVVTYYGANLDNFAKHFSSLGTIKVSL